MSKIIIAKNIIVGTFEQGAWFILDKFIHL